MGILRTTRSELHALVWSKPLRDVAKQLSMSDVGIAKLCTRNKVPRPSAGYWQRKDKREARPPLRGEDKPIIVYLRDKPSTLADTDIEIPEVPASSRAHKEVARCRADLKGASPDEYGRLVSKRIDMLVSRKSLPRALSLLDQIVRTALKLGCRVDTPGNGIQFTRGSETVGLCLFETSTQTRREVKYSLYETTQRIYTPSGHLKVSLSGEFGLYGVRHEWNDRPTKPLESQLINIMHGILRAMEHVRLKRIEQAEQRRRYQVELRLTERRKRVYQLTRDRRQRVDELIDAWERSRHIRQVIDEMETQGAVLPIKEQRLIRWAEDLARHYDPLDSFVIDALSAPIG